MHLRGSDGPRARDVTRSVRRWGELRRSEFVEVGERTVELELVLFLNAEGERGSNYRKSSGIA